MTLKIATHKPTGLRYYYETSIIFGRIRYTADCSADCYGPGAVKQTWHSSLTKARKTAQERGTLLPVPETANDKRSS